MPTWLHSFVLLSNRLSESLSVSKLPLSVFITSNKDICVMLSIGDKVNASG